MQRKEIEMEQKEKTKRPVCSECGSGNVLIDGWGKWNVETQTFSWGEGDWSCGENIGCGDVHGAVRVKWVLE